MYIYLIASEDARMKFKLRDGIKYAMFDMDGTLLDTMMHWRTVGIEYMDERDIMRATPELFRQFAPAKYSGQYRMSYQNSEIDFTVIFEKMEKKYASLSPLTPGMDEVLSDLRDRGIRMSVVSATPKNAVEIALKTAGVRDFFDIVLSTVSDENEAGKVDFDAIKDKPSFYFEHVKLFDPDADPSQLAVFEDNCNNLRAAKQAGCYTVGFCDYYQSGLGWDVPAWSDELVPPDYERQKAMLEAYISSYEFKNDPPSGDLK